MPNTITCGTELANSYPVQLQVRSHKFRSDVGVSSGSTDSAPGPHDYFETDELHLVRSPRIRTRSP